MYKDPIVEEIHQTREKLLQACGGDMEKYMEFLQSAEAQDADRLISLEESMGELKSGPNLTKPSRKSDTEAA